MTKQMQAAVQRHVARVSNMTGEELLVWLDQNKPLPWEERNVNGPMMTVRRHALARLDALTR